MREEIAHVADGKQQLPVNSLVVCISIHSSSLVRNGERSLVHHVLLSRFPVGPGYTEWSKQRYTFARLRGYPGRQFKRLGQHDTVEGILSSWCSHGYRQSGGGLIGVYEEVRLSWCRCVQTLSTLHGDVGWIQSVEIKHNIPFLSYVDGSRVTGDEQFIF